jgi:hypothetical protein
MTIRVQLMYLNTKGVTTLLLNILHNSKSSRLALLGGLLLLHNTKTLRTTLLEGLLLYIILHDSKSSRPALLEVQTVLKAHSLLILMEASRGYQ